MNLDNASVCKYCWKTISKKRMHDHLVNDCKDYPYAGKSYCEHCKVWMKSEKMEEHIRNKHKK